MARDHALASGLGPGRAVLRLYRWTRPTLSLGRNEPAVGVYDPELARERGVDVVRRPTGGRAVLHHRELTYAVLLPVRALGGVRASYLAVNRALRRGLASLGVPADIAGRRGDVPAPGPDAGPCFRAPAPGELTAEGRKLVGSAQARIGRTILQHGSILVADDQGLLGELAPEGAQHGADDAPGAPATLEGLLGGDVPGWDALGDALVAGCRLELGGRWEADPPEPDPSEEADLLDKYRSHAWTWRR